MPNRVVEVTFCVGLCLGALLLSGGAWAQGSSSTQQTAVVIPKVEKTWSTSASLSKATSLNNYQDGTQTESVDSLVTASYKIFKNYSLSTLVTYSNDLRKPEISDWSDTPIILAPSSWAISRTFKFSPSFFIVAPTSKDSRVRQSMQVAAGAGLGFGFNAGILIPGLTLGTSLSLSRLFHEYETALDGKVNSQYSSKQSISGVYSLKKFSLTLEVLHRNSMTYQGNLKEAFEHTEELGFAVSDHFSLAIGHGLHGSVYKANAQDTNLSLINENDSKVYGAVSAIF